MLKKKPLFISLFIFLLLFLSGALFLLGGHSKDGAIWSIVPKDFRVTIGANNISDAFNDLRACPIESVLKDKNKKDIASLKKYIYFLKGNGVFCVLSNNWFASVELGYKALLVKGLLTYFSSNEGTGRYKIKAIKFKDTTIFEMMSKNNIKYYLFVYRSYFIVAGNRDSLFEVIGCILNNKPSLLKQDIPFEKLRKLMSSTPFYGLVNTSFAPKSSMGKPGFKSNFCTFSAKSLQFDYYLPYKEKDPYKFIKQSLNIATATGVASIIPKKEYNILNYRGLNLYYNDTGTSIYGSNSIILYKNISPSQIKDKVYIEVAPSTILFLISNFFREYSVSPDYNKYLRVMKRFTNIQLTMNKGNNIDAIDCRARIILKR